MRKTNLSAEDKALIEQEVVSGLHCLYDDTLHKPLPDRMVELVEQLQEREAAPECAAEIH